MNELSTIVDINRNPAVVFLAGVSSGSRKTYRFDLEGIAKLLGYRAFDCPWEALRFQHTIAIRARLTEIVSPVSGRKLKPVTINRKLCVLRGVLKSAWRLGLMDGENYYRAADIPAIRGTTIPSGRELSDNEITRLMEACARDLTEDGVRDAAIIALMYTCGLRRSEVIGLDLTDYNPANNQLRIIGKGQKERTGYLVNESFEAMMDWLDIRGKQPGPIFWPRKGGFGNLVCRRMSNNAIYVMLIRRGKQAGLSHFTPHDLRRTNVSRLLEAGVDINTVSKLMGHASVTTTARYDKRGEVTKHDAAKLLHVAYKHRGIKP